MLAYESQSCLSKREAVRPYQYALVLAAVGCFTFGVVWLVMLSSVLRQLEACVAPPSAPVLQSHLVFDPLYIQGSGQKR